MKTTLPILKRFIGNQDAYATQDPETFQWGPHRAPVTDAVLRDHLAGKHTVGTYILTGDQARHLVFDIDEENDEVAEETMGELLHILNLLGFKSGQVGVTTTGNRGFHIWLVFAKHQKAANLRRIGRAALADLKEKGFTSHIDVFPKQDEARDLGNLIRIPGGRHPKTGAWAEWRRPVAQLITTPFLENEILADLPEVSVPVGGGHRPDPFPCMMHIQEGVGEGSRNTNLFHLAVMARRGGLNDENVEVLIRATNDKNDPPLEEDEIVQLLESSRWSGPLCRQLEGGPTHCGDKCILNRSPGLYSRPGTIKYGADGEFVVVQIKERTGQMVRLKHDDTEDVKGVVK